MTLHHNGLSKMIFLLIFLSCFVTNVRSQGVRPPCLTGYMTDLQSWVDKSGRLTSNVDHKRSLDLSGSMDSLNEVSYFIEKRALAIRLMIKYFSLANCGLQRIPAVFTKKDRLGRSLADTLEYITFYGNNFTMVGDNDYDVRINATNAVELKTDIKYQTQQLKAWGSGIKGIVFTRLKELDLRACSIQTLNTDTFYRMTNLRSIYLSENNIFFIEANTFSGLINLKHLDLSRNFPFNYDKVSKFLVFQNFREFEELKIESLDFSFTPFGHRNLPLIRSLGRNLKRLSLCYSDLGRLESNAFNGTFIKYLDLSGNVDVLRTRTALRGLENTLQVLYAQEAGMKNMDSLLNFNNLEILKLTSNEITSVPRKVALSLKNLQILDLNYNRIISWFKRIFSYMPKLKFLSLNYNNINIVSYEMYYDIQNLMYFGISNNVLVCSCYLRDILEVNLRNEMVLKERRLIGFITNNSYGKYVSFQTGLDDFNKIILNRHNSSTSCTNDSNCTIYPNSDLIGNYLLLNDDLNGPLNCLVATKGKTINVKITSGCTDLERGIDYSDQIGEGWNKLILLIIPTIVLPCVIFTYVYRKNLRYFLITMKNSTMLSLISTDNDLGESTIFNYDVFVSYCNEDRTWVLENLLPHLERDCNISVCLHERDFQVGLSILENIVSCMDRSRSIMLIISQRFLLSQWCQFEMHLAQHRLLETRREDLILVLLEEIPRRLRPNTLHYLMLTKTYIIWSDTEMEQNLFWRRMNKSIVTLKFKHSENVSLA